MFERYEEDTERGLVDSESQTEQVETALTKIAEDIQALENALSNLKDGDDKLRNTLQGELQEKQTEQEAQKREADRISQALAQIEEKIRQVDSWNEEAASEIGDLESVLQKPLPEATNRIADRQRWVEQNDAKAAQLRQRLNQLSQNSFG